MNAATAGAAAAAAAAAASGMSFRRYEDRHATVPLLERRCLTHLILIGNERHEHARYVVSCRAHNLIILTPRRAEAFSGGSTD
jgi:cobalamin biosynthesis protein CbiD